MLCFARQNGLATTMETMNLADMLDLLMDKLPGFRRQIAERVSDDVAGEGAAAALEECQFVVSLWSVCGTRVGRCLSRVCAILCILITFLII